MANRSVLVVTALSSEFDAAKEIFSEHGVAFTDGQEDTTTPYVAGTLQTNEGGVSIFLARPTRMGATATGAVVASLAERLRPSCLAMSGVCAGNPSDVSLGDVIVAEMAYTYDEGKRTAGGFIGDHRQVPLSDEWLRIAQEISPETMQSYARPNEELARLWILGLLVENIDPRSHPAREKMLGHSSWREAAQKLEKDSLIKRDGTNFHITQNGKAIFAEHKAYEIEAPDTMPFSIHVGPMASGNVVVKDGVTWEMLKSMGVRTVLGLEMEAATIAQTAFRLKIPNWLVVKGVMDYADPNKADSVKSFASKASAEVLISLIARVPLESNAAEKPTQPQNPDQSQDALVIGNVVGNGNTIIQKKSS